MIVFNWNSEKNEWLKKNRGICFEDITYLVSEGNLLDIINNPSPNFSNQQIFVILFKDYIYLVPFVKNRSEYFLKTIIPSRKATKKYLGESTK
ncbi:MAG: toxin [Prolixibacteraceae bacterium]|jgi:uncharacterized DUF497 family protein|nr:toxin [Prolixibacteraceae bacterium]MBT6764133.1 toxin [Prolixibacteraceae bacterium]MBT6999002.1 toxin [Prolixibacteraceae bacterium]MBT7394499.1 toxin [Prolixibacteraceae bacterium]